jgi:hypothetical protein
MENFSGVVSLFIACVEVVLLINLIIFSKKDRINKLIIAIVALLFSYQFMEFIMCYTQNYSSNLVYFSFLIISFLPPLLLYLTLTIKNSLNRYTVLVFIPIIVLLSYYLFVISEFEITSCTVLFAAYEMPLGDLYGVIYYSPIIATIYLLVGMIKNKNYEKQKTNLLIFVSGILLTFVPIAFIIAMFPFLLDYVESFFCKAASLIAITLTIFAIRNSDKTKKVNDE